MTLCVINSRDQSLVNQIYVRSTNREKRTEVYPKGTKRFAFFLGFFEGQKNANFFFLEKTKSHVRIKRDWQYTFVAIIIVSAFAKGAFRKREREDEDESAEKDAREGKRCFVVGFDREERRYNFHSYFTEIECD